MRIDLIAEDKISTAKGKIVLLVNQIASNLADYAQDDLDFGDVDLDTIDQPNDQPKVSIQAGHGDKFVSSQVIEVIVYGDTDITIEVPYAVHQALDIPNFYPTTSLDQARQVLKNIKAKLIEPSI